MKNKNLLTNNFEIFINNYSERLFRKNIAVAVSGGCDSIALAYLTDKFKSKYEYNIIALTLDHQLRKESADETKFVKDLMHKLEIPHHSLSWTEEKPSTRIQETARIARYNILAEACNKYKCEYLFLGHHADDQLETFIIRLNAKSGLDGLSCMQEESRILTNNRSLNLIRPLLKYRKETLKNICKNSQLKWIEDPSNYDMKYLRSKTRKLLVHNNVFDDFYKCIDLFKSVKDNTDKIIYNYMKNDIYFNDIGICSFSMKKFINLPNFLQVKLLNFLIRVIGGKKYPRKNKVINRVLSNILSETRTNTTVGGAYLKINKHDIVMFRQLDNSFKISELKNLDTIWDRRFIVKNKTNKYNLTIGPLGEKDYLKMNKLNKIQKPSINFNAIKTIPAIRVLEQIVSVPHLLYWKSNFWKNNVSLENVEHKLFKQYKNFEIFKLGEKL